MRDNGLVRCDRWADRRRQLGRMLRSTFSTGTRQKGFDAGNHQPSTIVDFRFGQLGGCFLKWSCSKLVSNYMRWDCYVVRFKKRRWSTASHDRQSWNIDTPAKKRRYGIRLGWLGEEMVWLDEGFGVHRKSYVFKGQLFFFSGSTVILSKDSEVSEDIQ